MKKAFLIFMSMVMFTSCIGCSESSGESEESLSVPAQPQMQLKSADVDIADDFSEILCIDRQAENFLVFGKLKSGDYGGYVADAYFSKKKKFTFDVQEETVKTASLTDSGEIAVLSVLDGETFIHILESGSENPENSYDLGEILSPDDNFTQILCTDEGYYINIARQSLAFVDSSGNYKGRIETGGRNICGITRDKDGGPCVLLSSGIEMTLGKLSGSAVSEETSCGELASDVNAICQGYGEYEITVVATGGLYALSNGKWLKITDFSENDFHTYNIFDIDMTENSENEFIVLMNTDEKYEVRLLTERDISEIDRRKTVTVALTYGTPDPYTDRIKKYNSENDKYKIEFVDYFSENLEDTYDQLKLDIISGKGPDIVAFSEYMTVESLGSNKNFVDFYSLIDSDSEIDRSDFVEGFLEDLETKGELLQITPSFVLNTNMIKDKFAGGLKSWNLEEFENIYRNMPENMDFSISAQSDTKYDIFKQLTCYSRFIDMEKSECHFDSPEFISEIQLIKDLGIGVTEDDFGGSSTYAGTLINSFRNDDVLVLNINNMWGFRDMKIYQQVYSGEDCTFIGFPGDEKVNAFFAPSKTFGIMADSDNVEGAWDFLKYYMFEEESLSEPDFTGFSGLKDLLDKQLLDECTDKEDSYIFFDGTEDPEQIEIELKPFTDEEADENKKFVLSALKNPRYYNHDVEVILSEELNPFFEGECSAEDAAERIQNRVSVYLSEQS